MLIEVYRSVIQVNDTCFLFGHRTAEDRLLPEIEREADTDNEAFGYQEAWAEYRYKPNEVHGEFRSNYSQSLDSWHWADNYTAQPYLSGTWRRETEVNVNRTIAVSDSAADQFMADIWFDSTWTRAMPIYSVPGLIDHH